MDAETFFGLLIPVTFFVMMAIEAVWPARAYPKVKLWRLVGTGFLVLLATISTILPLVVPVEWLAKHRLVDGTRLGVAGGVIVGYAVVTLIGYAYHRACHRFSFLWRWFHQLHHSAERLDVAGSVYFHPLEIVAYSMISVLVATLGLGLDPLAAAILGYVAAFYGTFQHLNVKTPRSLGYFIQRPESHGRHHEQNVHGYNYSDLPLWDILFGTFQNPATFEGNVGFGARAPLGRMLVGRDVSGGLGAGLDAASRAAGSPAAARVV